MTSTPTLFFRLLAEDDKAGDLDMMVASLREGRAEHGVFAVEPAAFGQVPDSPLLYWVSHLTRSLFSSLPPLESEGRENRVGLQTSDNFRFLRAWWEVSPIERGSKWYPYAKGGGYSPFYRDFHLCVNWGTSGQEIKEFAISLGNSPSRSVRSEDHYLRPALTYSDRCTGGFAPSPLPQGAIFDVKGSCIFVAGDDPSYLMNFLGVALSKPFRALLAMRSGTHSLAQSFQVGQISSTPVPTGISVGLSDLGELARRGFDAKRRISSVSELSYGFTLPVLLLGDRRNLQSDFKQWSILLAETLQEINTCQNAIDHLSYQKYNIDDYDRIMIENGLIIKPSDVEIDDSPSEDEEDQEYGHEADPRELVAGLVSYSIGCALGRWDVRFATGERQPPPLPNPFAPLPVCSLGMLQGDDGLPLRETPPGYPLRIDWDGILVDDPDHPDDVVRRIRDVLTLVWGDRADPIEAEACAMLGIKDLREYLRRSGADGFWQDHVKRYSKSRRKAPIYWLLQSPKKHYAIWLYLHRLDGDTLFKALMNYVEPKLRLEESRLTELQAARGQAAAGHAAHQAERAIERQEALLADLREFGTRLERAALLYLTPDLNDGVVLTIAPLWELVPWSEPKAYSSVWTTTDQPGSSCWPASTSGRRLAINCARRDWYSRQ